MSRTVGAVDNTCAILELLRKRGGMTVSELATETELAPGTVHTHLATLRERKYVTKDGGEYRLGCHLLALGESLRNNHPLYRAASERVEELAEETRECAHLIVQRDGQLYALYERFGADAVGVEYHDTKREQPLTHLHCTAAGKAILSVLSAERVRSIVEQRGLPPVTPNTITDMDELTAELEAVRERGYAFADAEQMDGLRAVGAPITSDDDCIGAIAVSGPTARLTGERFQQTLPAKVVQAANICEINLRTRAEEMV